MSKRNKGSRPGVRGPNSALTEFLRVEGITNAFRQRRQNQSEAPSSNSGTGSPERDSGEGGETRDGSVVPEGSLDEQDTDSEVEELRIAARRKRRAARRINRAAGGFPGDSGGGSDDSGDSDDSDDGDYSDGDGNKRFNKIGDESNCVDCGRSFRMTVYSRYHEGKKGYLCDLCKQKLAQFERNARRNQLNARKKRKKVSQALLDKTEVKLPKLQDICIKKISDNIDDVDALGDIGQVNLIRISRILTKNRSLNDNTVGLFLDPSLKSLQFWDCSNVGADSFNKIAAYCPNLESLSLFMCGQFHNDNLKYFGSQLQHLTELNLNGPFLISDLAWQEYFEGGGSRLTKFEIRNTHRFGNDSLISLLEICGSNLTRLKLSRLDGLNAKSVYDLIPHYIGSSKLQSLEISYPFESSLIDDELIINILSIAGESLTHLNLDGCSNLTDRFLIEGISVFCPSLTHLSLKHLEKLTDQGFATAFNSISQVNNGGLISVDMTKCIHLGNEAVYALLKHSSTTLVELSLNSVYNLDRDFLSQILTPDSPESNASNLTTTSENLSNPSPNGTNASNDNHNPDTKTYDKIDCPLLTTLDIGFVRSIDDEILNLLSTRFKKLSILEVHGNNRCSLKAKTRNNLMIIGRQNDII